MKDSITIEEIKDLEAKILTVKAALNPRERECIRQCLFGMRRTYEALNKHFPGAFGKIGGDTE